MRVKRGGHRKLGLGVLGGGVPEQAEEHVGAGLHNPGRHALYSGSPVLAGRLPLADATLRPSLLLHGCGRGLVVSAEIHLIYR